MVAGFARKHRLSYTIFLFAEPLQSDDSHHSFLALAHPFDRSTADCQHL